MDSYAQGETTPALLEETIGANLERTVASYADREALVERASGRRWTWAELDRDVDAVARGLIGAGIEKGDRVGIWGPNSAEWTLVQLATAKVGAILVNVNPSYRTHELAYVVNQSGMRMLVSATSFKTSDYRAMIQETADRLDTLERVVHLDDEHSWAGLLADGSGVSADDLRARSASLDAARPDQHPVHVRHHGLPEGRDPQPPQHPQQRLPRRRGLPLHRGGPGLHPGALLPLLRDGDGQPRVHQPRRHDGDPGARLRPGPHPACRVRRAVHLALRRADDVHRGVGAARPRRRTTWAACAPGSWPARRAPRR